MAEDMRLTGPVNVQADGPSRVAFDLMSHIGDWEDDTEGKKGRDYWLRLYSQCRRAVIGDTLERTLNRNG